MTHTRFSTFDDPDRFQEAVGFNCKFLTKASGFGAELVSIDLGRLWMKGASSSPAFTALLCTGRRVAVSFRPGSHRGSARVNGLEASPDYLILGQQDSAVHIRTQGHFELASMSLTAEDLAASSGIIAGREIMAASYSQILRPPPGLMARLRAAHHAACEQVRNSAISLQHPAAVRAMQEELIQRMLMCLVHSPPQDRRRARGARVVARFEEYLESKACEPVYVPEICAAIGVSGSTLRNCCQEQLGMGPIHYLWLRRMNLARRALLAGHDGAKSVTAIATECGFWELGRFSVGYRKLFGEAPSATLKRSREAASGSTLH